MSYADHWAFQQISSQLVDGRWYPQPHRNRIVEIMQNHEAQLSSGDHWVLTGFAYLPKLSPGQWERLKSIEDDLQARGFGLCPF